MFRHPHTLLALGLVLGAAAPALVQDPAPAAQRDADAAPKTVEEITRTAHRVAYYQGKDGRANVKMEIVDAQGRTRTREMTILRRDEPDPEAKEDAGEDADAKADEYCGEQSYYVRFTRPADVDKTTFMVHKKPGADDDRWLYLPALDLVKRVSSADKRSSFVGSHFFYEDVSGRHLEADTYTLAETTDNYWVVDAVPKEPSTVEFASYRMWIHRGSSVTVKVEYRDAEGEVYRTYEAKGVEEVQGFQTVVQAKMSDLRTKGSTTVTYTDVKYDVGLPEDLFTERYLRRAPREYIK